MSLLFLLGVQQRFADFFTTGINLFYISSLLLVSVFSRHLLSESLEGMVSMLAYSDNEEFSVPVQLVKTIQLLRQQKSRKRLRYHFYRQGSFMPTQKCVSFFVNQWVCLYLTYLPKAESSCFSHETILKKIKKRSITESFMACACLQKLRSKLSFFQYSTYTPLVFVTRQQQPQLVIL